MEGFSQLKGGKLLGLGTRHLTLHFGAIYYTLTPWIGAHNSCLNSKVRKVRAEPPVLPTGAGITVLARFRVRGVTLAINSLPRPKVNR